MATTITPATLTVTVTESVVLNDAASTVDDHGHTVVNELTIGSIKTITKVIVPVTVTETGLASFAATNSGAPGVAFATYVVGHFVEADVKHIRITNLDDTNQVIVKFRSAADDEYSIRLDAGQTHFYNCDNAAGTVATMLASGTPLADPPVQVNLEDIVAKAVGGTCDLEVFIALD